MSKDLAATFGPQVCERLAGMKVLLVGAGGIGCEVLKNLVILDIRKITVIDLDTIDISNLNRQFLFQRRHVGQSKSQIAVESCLRFVPRAKRSGAFDVVINALDNVEARRHVNYMCIQGNIPLLETGTAGYFGQSLFMMNRFTECYDCYPKPTPKTFAVCTIRSTPSAPIHCIVWAKSHLLGKLFTSDQDLETENVSSTEMNDSNAEQFKLMAKENDAFRSILAARGDTNFGDKVFQKVFQVDPSVLAALSDLWKDREAPKPLDLEISSSASEELIANDSAMNLDEQKEWSLKENTIMFFDSIKRLNERFMQNGKQTTISFDKDDEDTMDFVASAANLRSLVYGIKVQTRFQAKSMAGNIIPAIATTNAIVSGLAVLNLIRIAEKTATEANNVAVIGKNTCFNSYLTFHTNMNKLFSLEYPPEPNMECAVCHTNRAVLQGGNIESMTIKRLLEEFVFPQKLLTSQDVCVTVGSQLLFDPDFDDNETKSFKSLNLLSGKILTVRDEEAEEVPLIIFIQKSENVEDVLELKSILEPYSKASKKKRSREDGESSSEMLDSGSQIKKSKVVVSTAEAETEATLCIDDDQSIVLD